jgi:hypothetical protein
MEKRNGAVIMNRHVYNEEIERLAAESRTLSQQLATIYNRRYELDQEFARRSGGKTLPRFEVWLEEQYRIKVVDETSRIWAEYAEVLDFWKQEHGTDDE